MVSLGVEDLAKYPFLEEAGEYVRKHGLSLSDISHQDFSKVIGLAEKRVLQAIARREVSAEIDEEFSAEIGEDVSAVVVLLSFPLALMLIKATKLDHLISHYSHAEALRVEKLLEDERKDLVVQIFRNVLKIDLTESDRPPFDYKIPVIEYLKRATRFHDTKWMLMSRVVDKGYVYLRVQQLIRLIRQEIDDIIRRRLKDLAVPRLPENFGKTVQEISLRSPPPSKMEVRVTPDKYPPCITTALSMLQKGENLPHYARFLLTTYLVNIGKSADEITALYPRSPDFNERMTRYQVEHIAGLRGGRVKYRCPSCRTMVIHGFCFKTEECDDIKNPLQFGFRRLGVKKKGKKDE